MNLMTLKSRLENYLEAERKILSGGAEYQIGSRRLTRANLADIRATIKDLQEEIAMLENSTGRIAAVVFT
ncbi:MAG: hypothetical protein II968_01150 [Selenomonadaceae bacterium]|nr:hypothetical protein [Selenomonadaceae bacterium]MBR0060465.1 hypothetical protein [Selenomonadaceae bacterium]